MRGLYAIVDVGALAARRCEPVAFAEAVLDARPAALQLRAKDVSARETLGILRAIAPSCRRAGVLLVANDRPDLALLAGCDRLHVGQDDIPIELARRLAPGIGIGVSTHNLVQLDAAIDARPAYVAFGPVFETQSKRNPDPVVGVEALRQAHARTSAAGIPLVAIGGVTRERAHALIGATDAAAVIGDLLPPILGEGGSGEAHSAATADALREVTRRARELHELWVRREPVVKAVQ
ncbi:MAG: thiamine phosphate synthase [Polyangiaceae bacterium]|nr:thiamine phosphate synthase [Polyangiaceae bacterium]